MKFGSHKILIVILSLVWVNQASGERYVCDSGQTFWVNSVVDWSAVVLHILNFHNHASHFDNRSSDLLEILPQM